MTKLSIGQAWSETVGTVKRDGRLIVPVALAFAVIPATLFALAVPPVPAGEMREPGSWMLFYPLLILAALIGQMAIMRMAIGPAASVGEAIRHALRRAPFGDRRGLDLRDSGHRDPASDRHAGPGQPDQPAADGRIAIPGRKHRLAVPVGAADADDRGGCRRDDRPGGDRQTVMGADQGPFLAAAGDGIAVRDRRAGSRSRRCSGSSVRC